MHTKNKRPHDDCTLYGKVMKIENNTGDSDKLVIDTDDCQVSIYF
jgi:hypothetical protein